MTLVERLRDRAKQMDVIASPEAARSFGYGPEKVAWHKEAADEAREAADRIEELERRASERLLVIGDEDARIAALEEALRDVVNVAEAIAVGGTRRENDTMIRVLRTRAANARALVPHREADVDAAVAALDSQNTALLGRAADRDAE